MDAEDVGPGQPKPYCGELPSLAALNVREAKLEKLVDNLDYPWAFEFINDNELLVTEFSGKLKHLTIDTGNTVDIPGLPEMVRGKGQAGLLDIVLDPEFEQNKAIYFSYAIENGDKQYALAVARGQLEDDRLTAVERIFVALPYGKSRSNFGGALLFDAEGFLLISSGDRSIRSHAQHPGTLTGKVIRLRTDGSVPASNPFAGKGEVFAPAIYAMGVRNPQGLALDPQTGTIYETEHGPMGGDEVNVIQAGRNYGWPVITYGLNYTYEAIGEGGKKAGMEQPIFYYLPSIAVSPIAVYRGEMFKEWDGDLLVGALKGSSVSKLDLVDGRIQSEYKLLGELSSRVRDVKVAPDGAIWILLQTGELYRLSRDASPLQQATSVGKRTGEHIYLTTCSTCHSQGVVGVPQISRREDWTERLQQPRKALRQHVIDGLNDMPERGLCDDCTDKEINMAVDFMVKQVKFQAPG